MWGFRVIWWIRPIAWLSVAGSHAAIGQFVIGSDDPEVVPVRQHIH